MPIGKIITGAAVSQRVKTFENHIRNLIVDSKTFKESGSNMSVRSYLERKDYQTLWWSPLRICHWIATLSDNDYRVALGEVDASTGNPIFLTAVTPFYDYRKAARAFFGNEEELKVRTEFAVFKDTLLEQMLFDSDVHKLISETWSSPSQWLKHTLVARFVRRIHILHLMRLDISALRDAGEIAVKAIEYKIRHKLTINKQAQIWPEIDKRQKGKGPNTHTSAGISDHMLPHVLDEVFTAMPMGTWELLKILWVRALETSVPPCLSADEEIALYEEDPWHHFATETHSAISVLDRDPPVVLPHTVKVVT